MTMLPALFGTPDDTPAGRLLRFARVQALERMCKDEISLLRESMEVDADGIESLTGGAYNVPVAGIGRVLRTDPQPKPFVADRTLLAEWMQRETPDLTSERATAVIARPIDDDKLVAAIVELASLVSLGPDIPVIDQEAVWAVMVELHRALDIVNEVLIPDDPIGVLIGQDLAFVDGVTVLSADGEVIPGINVKKARRQLNVTIYAETKKEADRTLRSVLSLNPTEA